MSHTPMTAPAPTSNFPTKEKRSDIQLIPMGTHPIILTGIVNIGTQDDEYQGKPTSANKIKFSFEFPNHRQLFYVDDTVPKPSVLTMTFIYSISKNKKNNKKSALLCFIEGIFGPLPESQYLTFDISKMLGQMYFGNVKHYFKKDGITVAQKIDSVYPFNPAIINPASVHARTNDLRIYDIQMGFECPQFASLYYFEREEIKNSREGKAHAAAGGLFVKLDDNGNMIYETQGQNAAQAPAIPQRRLVMTNPAGPTADQYRAQGWTDDNMVLQGHARYEDVVQTAPQAPAVPAFQQPTLPTNTAPVIQQTVQQPIVQQTAQAIPQIPAVPTIPVVPVTQGLIMTNPAGPTYEQMIAGGWNDDLLVQHGHATRPAPVAPVVPVIPIIPAVPSIPQVPQTPAVPVAPVIPQAPVSAVDLFQQTPAAPVQNITTQSAPVAPTVPLPGANPLTAVQAQAPIAPVSTFETPIPLPTVATNNDEENDDLPF